MVEAFIRIGLSVVKAITEVEVHLAWLDKMSSTKRVAVIQQEPRVAKIYSLQRDRPALTKAFAERKIKRSVPGKMIGPITVEKARPVTHITRYIAPRLEVYGNARAEGIALVVIQKE